MDSSLGSKIKALRKELKMTQSQLAEPEMTKSMISQIENGQAMPSMKNLQFIAKKLNKSAAYFLEDGISGICMNCSDHADEIVTELKNIDGLIKDDKFREALSRLEALGAKSNLNSKLLGDIAYRKGQCMQRVDRLDEGERFLTEAYEIYLESNNYTEAAKAYIDTALKSWRSFDYENCIEIYEKAKGIYDKSPNRDTHFEIELSNDLAVFHSAKGDFDKSLEYLKSALDISKTTGVYYKADEIHRLTAALYFIKGDNESYQLNIEKAEQFARFSDNKNISYYISAIKAAFENSRGDYKKALKYLEDMKNAKDEVDHFYYREKAKSLYYMGEYQEALENIKLVDYPAYLKHRFDYLMMWSSKVYEGLIYSELGEPVKALESILAGIENMRRFENSKLLAFALESASEIYYETGQPEKAYEYLKEAKDMKDTIARNNIYF